MASQALASLTATYTDSEGEENVDEDEQQELGESQSGSSSVPSTPPQKVKPEVVTRAKTRLVSYHDDTIASDDDDDPIEEEPEVVPEEPEVPEVISDDSAIDKKWVIITLTLACYCF